MDSLHFPGQRLLIGAGAVSARNATGSNISEDSLTALRKIPESPRLQAAAESPYGFLLKIQGVYAVFLLYLKRLVHPKVRRLPEALRQCHLLPCGLARFYGNGTDFIGL